MQQHTRTAVTAAGKQVMHAFMAAHATYPAPTVAIHGTGEHTSNARTHHPIAALLDCTAVAGCHRSLASPPVQPARGTQGYVKTRKNLSASILSFKVMRKIHL
jgi:hypothetical protein